MAYWEAPVEGYPPGHRDFARIWQKAEKIVFSRTLTSVPTRIARIERDFDPKATRKLKRESEPDIFIGGGKPAFRAALRRDLELLETRHFGTGVVHLHYRVRGR
jgi:dihydrofolate reductase